MLALLNKVQEEPSLKGEFLRQGFRVPLNAEHERMIQTLNAFNDSVFCHCAYDQSCAESLDRLVMRGVHLQGFSFHDPVQQCSRVDSYKMASNRLTRGLLMFACVGKLGRDVLVKGAPESDVDRLGAPANTEDW